MLLQVYEGLVYMDFNKQIMDKQGYGTDSENVFLCTAYYWIYFIDHRLDISLESGIDWRYIVQKCGFIQYRMQ